MKHWQLNANGTDGGSDTGGGNGMRACTALASARVRAVCVLTCVLVLLTTGVLCSSCADDRSVAARGDVVTSDGVVLATSPNAEGDFSSQTRSVREYPQGCLASALVGSCYALEPSGIEGSYAADLEAGASITLTIDSSMQRACEDALEGKTGAAVLLDPESGAVLAMASSPAVDLGEVQASASAQESVQDALVNRAMTLHIPGSTFKTVTLAAALESGLVSMDTMMSAPSMLTVEGGSVTNSDTIQYGTVSVGEAYARSINTVFAQLSMRLGTEALTQMAESFGFGHAVAQDLDGRIPEIAYAHDMSALERAWYGAGQSLITSDGTIVGPLTSALHTSAMTACFANGGKLMQPYVIASMRDAQGNVTYGHAVVENEGFLSVETIEAIREGMRDVVIEGTARGAAVPGVDVRGKTGTAETSYVTQDGWFSGIATAADGRTVVITVLVESEESSSDAVQASSEIIAAVLG